MKRRLPVPLVPGARGGCVLDADLPPLSRPELDRILALVGGDAGGSAFGGSEGCNFCDECSTTSDECQPGFSGAL